MKITIEISRDDSLMVAEMIEKEGDRLESVLKQFMEGYVSVVFPPSVNIKIKRDDE